MFGVFQGVFCVLAELCGIVREINVGTQDRVGLVFGVAAKDTKVILCRLDEKFGIEMLAVSCREDRADADLVRVCFVINDLHAADHANNVDLLVARFGLFGHGEGRGLEELLQRFSKAYRLRYGRIHRLRVLIR